MGCLIGALAVVVIVPVFFAILGGVLLNAVEPYEQPTPVPKASTPPPATKPPSTPKPQTPPPTTPTPDPVPEPPTPEAIPERTFPPLPPPHSTDAAWVTVQQAALYAVEFPDLSGCPAPALLETMTDLQPYATAQLDCAQKAWRPVLAGLGLDSAEIPHYFYSGSSATSACGTSTAPAYYCSANGGAIYFGEDLLLGTSWDPIWAKDLIGHEYGHHLQGASGFFDAIYDLPAGNGTLRRNEIQATCFAFGMMRQDDSIILDRAFYDTLEPHLRSFYDDDIHGKPDSLAYWGMRGFHGSLVGECNTWLVGPELVR